MTVRSLARWCSVVLLLLAALVGPAPTASATTMTEIYGRASGPGNARAHVLVSLFTTDWVFIRSVKSTRGGVYRMTDVPAGTYRLQFSDLRPRWDVSSYATTDAVVTVPEGVPTLMKNVRLDKGAFFYGTVKVAGKPGRKALVRAVSQYGVTYETQANAAGEFALGGLPRGGYSVFAYDRRNRYAGTSIWVRKLTAAKPRGLRIRLDTRAAAYTGFLMVGDAPYRGSVWVTVVNAKTGQFWVKKVVDGDLSVFRGLYPGAYRLQIPATDQTRGQTVVLPPTKAGKVRSVNVWADPA